MQIFSCEFQFNEKNKKYKSDEEEEEEKGLKNFFLFTGSAPIVIFCYKISIFFSAADWLCNDDNEIICNLSLNYLYMAILNF